MAFDIGSILEGVNSVYSQGVSVFETVTGQSQTQPVTPVQTTQQPAIVPEETNESKNMNSVNMKYVAIGGGIVFLGLVLLLRD